MVLGWSPCPVSRGCGSGTDSGGRREHVAASPVLMGGAGVPGARHLMVVCVERLRDSSSRRNMWDQAGVKDKPLSWSWMLKSETGNQRCYFVYKLPGFQVLNWQILKQTGLLFCFGHEAGLDTSEVPSYLIYLLIPSWGMWCWEYKRKCWDNVWCWRGNSGYKSRSSWPGFLGQSQKAWGEKSLKEEEKENRMTGVETIGNTQSFWKNKQCSESTVWTGFKQYYFNLAICSNKGSARCLWIHKQWQSGAWKHYNKDVYNNNSVVIIWDSLCLL